MTCPRPDDPQWPTQAAARDVIAEAIRDTAKKYPVRDVPGGAINWGATEHELADAVLAALEAAGYHITHDPTPTQKAARIRKRRHLGSWSGWPRRSPR